MSEKFNTLVIIKEAVRLVGALSRKDSSLDSRTKSVTPTPAHSDQFERRHTAQTEVVTQVGNDRREVLAGLEIILVERLAAQDRDLERQKSQKNDLEKFKERYKNEQFWNEISSTLISAVFDDKSPSKDLIEKLHNELVKIRSDQERPLNMRINQTNRDLKIEQRSARSHQLFSFDDFLIQSNALSGTIMKEIHDHFKSFYGASFAEELGFPIDLDQIVSLIATVISDDNPKTSAEYETFILHNKAEINQAIATAVQVIFQENLASLTRRNETTENQLDALPQILPNQIDVAQTLTSFSGTERAVGERKSVLKSALLELQARAGYTPPDLKKMKTDEVLRFFEDLPTARQFDEEVTLLTRLLEAEVSEPIDGSLWTKLNTISDFRRRGMFWSNFYQKIGLTDALNSVPNMLQRTSSNLEKKVIVNQSFEDVKNTTNSLKDSASNALIAVRNHLVLLDEENIRYKSARSRAMESVQPLFTAYRNDSAVTLFEVSGIEIWRPKTLENQLVDLFDSNPNIVISVINRLQSDCQKLTDILPRLRQYIQLRRDGLKGYKEKFNSEYPPVGNDWVTELKEKISARQKIRWFASQITTLTNQKNDLVVSQAVPELTQLLNSMQPIDKEEAGWQQKNDEAVLLLRNKILQMRSTVAIAEDIVAVVKLEIELELRSHAGELTIADLTELFDVNVRTLTERLRRQEGKLERSKLFSTYQVAKPAEEAAALSLENPTDELAVAGEIASKKFKFETDEVAGQVRTASYNDVLKADSLSDLLQKVTKYLSLADQEIIACGEAIQFIDSLTAAATAKAGETINELSTKDLSADMRHMINSARLKNEQLLNERQYIETFKTQRELLFKSFNQCESHQNMLLLLTTYKAEISTLTPLGSALRDMTGFVREVAAVVDGIQREGRNWDVRYARELSSFPTFLRESLQRLATVYIDEFKAKSEQSLAKFTADGTSTIEDIYAFLDSVKWVKIEGKNATELKNNIIQLMSSFRIVEDDDYRMLFAQYQIKGVFQIKLRIILDSLPERKALEKIRKAEVTTLAELISILDLIGSRFYYEERSASQWVTHLNVLAKDWANLGYKDKKLLPRFVNITVGREKKTVEEIMEMLEFLPRDQFKLRQSVATIFYNVQISNQATLGFSNSKKPHEEKKYPKEVEKEREYVIVNGMTVGRGQSAQSTPQRVFFEKKTVSTNHGSFQLTQNGSYVFRDTSTNGTFVNDAEFHLTTSRELLSGDQISFGGDVAATIFTKNGKLILRISPNT